jgi:putative inorganic carbon (HCO3(-)) transporter
LDLQEETDRPSLFRRICRLLASVELWVVGGMVVVSIADPQFLLAAVITAALFWPLRRLAFGRWSLHTPGDLPIVLLLFMAVLSWWMTPLPQVTTPQVYRLLSGVALYYAIVNTSMTRQGLRRLVWLISLSGLALSLLAPLSVDWPLGKLPLIPAEIYQRFAVLVADSVHPNVIAGILALFLQVPLAWILFCWRELRGFEWALGALSLVGMSGVLLLSLSRGAWTAVALAVMALVVLRWRWGWVLVVLSLIAASAAIYWFGTARVLDVLIASKTVGSLNARLEIWGRAIDMILDFPFTGIGLGIFHPLADRLYPFLMFQPGHVFHAHNLFLQIAVDLGVPGLLAWAWTFLIATLSAGKVYHGGGKRQDPFLKALGAGLLASQIALLVHGMTDAVTWGMVRPAPLVWALWSIAVAASLYLGNSQAAGQRNAQLTASAP